MTRYTTTLNAIRKHSPCRDGWEKLLASLGKTKADDEPLDFLTILESNGIDDTLWCLRTLPAEADNAVRLLVCDLVEPAMQCTTDPRPAQALRVARRFALGKATRDELYDARDAARDAAGAAAGAAAWEAAGAAAWAAARDAAWAAAWAAARDAARDAARTAAGDAARTAARDAAEAAGWAAARDAAWAAARDAAWEAAKVEQERIFRQWLEGKP